MKLKTDFVTNSSSTAYIITNTSDHVLTLVDFVKENPQLIDQFKKEYSWYKEDDGYTQDKLIRSAELNNEDFEPAYGKYCTFGDEDGSLIGKVFDYILRESGESSNFIWKYEEALR